MKKVIRIILIAVVILIILGVGGCSVIIHLINERNKNYYKYATPQGEIEAKYTDLGPYDVTQVEYDANNAVYGKYEIWYPAELQDSTQKYPLVVMANGTGIKASQYKEVFCHLASWGFIVIGNEDENSRTGESSAAALEFVLNENASIDSIFYGKIDKENIGIAGHSQGGFGAINAVTSQANGINYKAVFAASTTSRYHADELNKAGDGWSCDLVKMNIPVFMVAGTGYVDAGNMDAIVVDNYQREMHRESVHYGGYRNAMI